MSKMHDFEFYYFKSISSTNDKAKEMADEGKSNIVVVAEKQEKGRGRFGRKWNSSLGGLYMTIVLEEKNPDKAKYMTFMASVAVAKTIRKLAKLNAMVKWPNDVLVNDKKVCGILTEIISGKKNYALIGIGLNVNQKKFDKEIRDKATSMRIESNKDFDIKSVSKSIIAEFNKLYQNYTIGDYGKILRLWKEYSHTLGRKIMAKTISGTYVGKAVDIDKDCSLVLKLDNGKEQKIIEGDIFIV